MEHLKGRKEFLNESNNNINWDSVEKFIIAVGKDYQFDDTNDDFLGFINLDPSDLIESATGDFRYVYDFMKSTRYDDSNYAKMLDLLKLHGLGLESADDEELIIHEAEAIHREMDPIEYLTERGAVETDKGWDCKFSLRLTDRRTPLIEKGKFVVKINSSKGLEASKCNLTSLEGAPLKCSGYLDIANGNYLDPFVVKFYENNVKEGINDFWLELLQHMIKNYPNKINNIEWPEGYLNDNLKKSAETLGKFNL